MTEQINKKGLKILISYSDDLNEVPVIYIKKDKNWIFIKSICFRSGEFDYDVKETAIFYYPERIWEVINYLKKKGFSKGEIEEIIKVLEFYGKVIR